MKTTTLLGMFALTSVFASGCDCFFGGGSCEETTTAAVATPETTQANNSVTKTVVMKVTGMSCQGCANALKSKVDSVNGVVSCDVSYEKGSASVALSNPDAEKNVEDTIKKLGYTVSVDTGDQPMNPAS